MNYTEQRLAHINAGRPRVEKTRKRIKPISDKRRAEIEAGKQRPDEKEKWFAERRIEMVGVCQCGCGNKSSKHDDDNFRSSASHIFPKAIFKSVMYHPANFVERAHWGGCHGNMDNTSIERWPKMADWEKIKEIFWTLSPLLTEKERTKKFYHKLHELVLAN